MNNHMTIDKFTKKFCREPNINVDQIRQSCIKNDFGYSNLVTFSKFCCISLCEHSMSPTMCEVHAGYLPSDVLLGVGSIAYIIEELAAAPNIQERLTVQIAQTIHNISLALFTIVVVNGSHYCSDIDVQRQHQSQMRSVHFIGDNRRLQKEFMAHVR